MSNLYLKVPGAVGSITTQAYQGWIAIYSMNFQTSRQVTMRVGHSGNRETSIPSFSELEITKSLDSASNSLFQAACSGKVIPQVEIHLCSTDSPPQAYAKYLLSNVIISQHAHAVSAGAKPFETLKLNYISLQITQISRDNTNQAKSPQVISYDLTTGQTG